MNRVIYPQVERSYGELLSRLTTGSVDLLWAPPLLAASAIGQRGAVPVACLARGGSGVYHSAFFAKKDKGWDGLSALEGKSVAWVDPRSAAGYVVPRRFVAAAQKDPETFFSHGVFGRTHEGVVEHVLRGSAEVGATYAVLESGTRRVLDAGWFRAGSRQDELSMVTTAGTVPADAIVASSRIPGPLLQELAAALAALGRSDRGLLLELFHSAAFVAPPSGYTKSLRDLDA